MKTLTKDMTAGALSTTHPIRFITADVVFGSPAKRCAGTGICKLQPHATASAQAAVPCCQGVSTDISLEPSGRLAFTFSRSGICKKLISRQFAFSRFRIEHALPLPHWLTQALQLPAAQLERGVYPVVFTKKNIKVSVRLRF